MQALNAFNIGYVLAKADALMLTQVLLLFVFTVFDTFFHK